MSYSLKPPELVENGEPNKPLIQALAAGLDVTKVYFELPGAWIKGTTTTEVIYLKKFLIDEFGPDVNIANVLAGNVFETEALRAKLELCRPATNEPRRRIVKHTLLGEGRIGERLGFVGLGSMGGPMCLNLVKGGFAATVYDVVAGAADPLLEAGAKQGQSLGDVARNSDIVVTMLPKSDDVEGVILSGDGIADNGREGMLVIDMSTIFPATSVKAAEVLKHKGIGFLDAAVGRTAMHAAAGTSMFMVGGDVADLERARPMLEAMGDTIHHCGPVGSGVQDETRQQLPDGDPGGDHVGGTIVGAEARPRSSADRRHHVEHDGVERVGVVLFSKDGDGREHRSRICADARAEGSWSCRSTRRATRRTHADRCDRIGDVS